MPDGIAEGSVDLGTTPNEIIKKPMTFAKKILAAIEMSAGAAASSMIADLITEKAKIDGNYTNAALAVASMLGAGAVDQPDLMNIFSGSAAGSVSKLASKLYDWLSNKLGITNPFKTSSSNSSSQSAATTNLVSSDSYTDGYLF